MLSGAPELCHDELLPLPDTDEEKTDDYDGVEYSLLNEDDELQRDETPFYANQMEDPEVYAQYQAYLDECCDL